MKKNVLTSLLLLAAITGGKFAKAQNQFYWRESFTTAASVTSDPGAGSAVYSYTGDAGTWILYGIWTTTATDCPATGQPTSSNRHIRSTNANTANLGSATPATTDDDTAYAITPVVNNGIQEFHIYRSRASRAMTVWKTSDTDPNTSNWTVAGVLPRSLSTCVDTTVLVSDANAKRLRIRFERAGNVDVDSIGVTSVTAILPVRYTGFSAVEANGKIKLNWGIATEVNTAKYVVERSANGRNFNEAGLLNASQSASYNWIDNSPITGTNYYRIKALDKDGSSQYTGIVKVTIGKKGSELVVLPNPVRGGIFTLQLTNFAAGVYSVSVASTLGQKVYTGVVNHDGGSTSKAIQMQGSVKPGVYTLQLLNKGSVVTKSLVVE